MQFSRRRVAHTSKKSASLQIINVCSHKMSHKISNTFIHILEEIMLVMEIRSPRSAIQWTNVKT